MEIINVKVGSPSQSTNVDIENPSQVRAEIKDITINTGGSSKAVLYYPQELTSEQKQQARANIDAASQKDLHDGVNEALKEAKESGDFDGKDGKDATVKIGPVSDLKELPELKIYQVTQEEYNDFYEAGSLDPDAVYVTPDGEYAPLNHTHSADSITDGVLPLARGGTGSALSRQANAIIRFSSNSAKMSSTATANGALYATGANGSPKFGILPIAQGGTGATTPEGVLANLGIVATAEELNNVAGSTGNIQGLLQDILTKLTHFLNVDDTTVDELSEVLQLIENNKGTLESLTTSKINVSAIVDNLTTSDSTKVLSAKQGVAIKSLIDALQTALDNIKVPTQLSELTDDVTHRTVTDAEKETWNNKSDFNGDYNALINTPSIPAVDSALSSSSTNPVQNKVVNAELSKKANDFSLEIYNGTGGNPKPVKFLTIDYSTCTSEAGVAIKVGMVSGHGNGSSYAFLQDAIIKVTHTGVVQVDNFKYYGASVSDGGVERQYGDIFWVIDTTNKIVDFYCLMGQYARLQMIPAKRVTYSTGGVITQHTSCTVYSSGEKIWGNNSEIALMSDIPTVPTITKETWTFTLEDGSTVTKEVHID